MDKDNVAAAVSPVRPRWYRSPAIRWTLLVLGCILATVLGYDAWLAGFRTSIPAVSLIPVAAERGSLPSS